MESHARSIVKALTYRVMGTVITFMVAWTVSGSIEKAFGIGLLDTAIKIGAYYGHERLWDKVALGKEKKPEYYI